MQERTALLPTRAETLCDEEEVSILSWPGRELEGAQGVEGVQDEQDEQSVEGVQGVQGEKDVQGVEGYLEGAGDGRNESGTKPPSQPWA